ncbi:molybdopterin-guanine dinucleotide biosynthesis protein B [Thiohalocapsa marina]|uniref:Molybdopterin-guanine dinucleotide biosynthesis protein B n=1 Tax=Thiohalocapsa marina TaxID=424902 RepID=A0A5M8FVH6_9GAMM|nr:molybdopterin-guanine dinucleotide biosynthesis protein B [Thiohalocapsa marina]KAA6187810.1 molybdopterin-guanine dinucleotide biosynthesis protein B [Thiohalocapsa marina]
MIDKIVRTLPADGGTQIACAVPLLGFAAFSGTGKTTLLEQLLPLLTAAGLRVGVVKHAHHQFDIDQPGKDSYRLRKAGASQMVVASGRRIAWIAERTSPAEEPRLADALAALDTAALDLVLIEGFKHEPYPKIELHRPSLGKPLLHPTDPSIIAIASDVALSPEQCGGLVQLSLNAPTQFVDFIADAVLNQAAVR